MDVEKVEKEFEDLVKDVWDGGYSKFVISDKTGQHGFSVERSMKMFRFLFNLILMVVKEVNELKVRVK